MALKTEPFVVNMGPQHPSTHGVFRMLVTLDGETIVDLIPVFGYLHRGTEKLAESRTYHMIIPYTDRLDYISGMSNNLAFCLAAEQLAEIPVPPRGQYLRVIYAELARIANHLMAIGFMLNDLGAFFTPLLYMFREREKILDLFEMTCGQRMTHNYMRIGGVVMDVNEETYTGLKRFIAEFPRYVDEFEALLTGNEILLTRTKMVGVLPRDLAISASTSGPVLRASGVPWDLRKAQPYCVYDRMRFGVPVGANGDCFDRYLVRIHEMRESTKIIEQALEQLPDGPVRSEVPWTFRPPVGDAYAAIENPKGELGFYLVSDGSIAPWRCHIRAPSFINLGVLRAITIGHKVADAVVILGSIDIVLGEVDR